MLWTSTCISARSVWNAINALAFSETVSPLTAWVTIKRDRTPPYSAQEHRSHHRQLMKRYERWCRKMRLPCAYITCFENPPGGILHSHTALHVPWQHFAAVRERFSVWVSPDPRVVSWGNHTTGYCSSATQRAGIMKYMLKGMDHHVCVNLGGRRIPLSLFLSIDDRGKGPQGIIEGKRLAISHSLCRQQRRLTGWPELRSPDELRRAINPPPRARRSYAA